MSASPWRSCEIGKMDPDTVKLILTIQREWHEQHNGTWITVEQLLKQLREP